MFVWSFWHQGFLQMSMFIDKFIHSFIIRGKDTMLDIHKFHQCSFILGRKLWIYIYLCMHTCFMYLYVFIDYRYLHTLLPGADANTIKVHSKPIFCQGMPVTLTDICNCGEKKCNYECVQRAALSLNVSLALLCLCIGTRTRGQWTESRDQEAEWINRAAHVCS